MTALCVADRSKPLIHGVIGIAEIRASHVHNSVSKQLGVSDGDL